jgi:hypothetical protein
VPPTPFTDPNGSLGGSPADLPFGNPPMRHAPLVPRRAAAAPRSPAARRRAARLSRQVTAAFLALGMLLALPVAAAAHGSLVVPTVRLDAAGDTVTVRWSAAEDDAAAIAVGLGLAPRDALLDHLAALAALDEGDDPQPLIDRLIAQVDQERLTGAPELDAYLLEAIVVAQDGMACEGRVGPTDDFLTGVAELTFTCPQPVDEIDLTVTVLLDQDPTHRTFSNDGSGEVALHSAIEPTHTWSLAGGAAGGVGLLLALVVGLVLTGLAGFGALALIGRPADGTAGPAPADPAVGSAAAAVEPEDATVQPAAVRTDAHLRREVAP